MANGLVIADIPGAVNRGLQFRQQQQLAPLQQQQAQGALRSQQQQFRTGELQQQNIQSQIDQRTDEQKSISLVNTALKVGTLEDSEIAPFLTSQINFVRSQGGNPAESERALELAQSGDFEGVRKGAKNLVDIGVRQGLIKAEVAAEKDKGFTLGAGQQRFDSAGNLIASGKDKTTVAVKPSALATFDALTEGLTGDQKKEATLIQLGLSPRAVGSAIQTIAGAGLEEMIGDASATIKQREKFGELTGSSRAKKIDQGFEKIGKINAGIGNIDRAVKLLNSGAGVGAIQKFLPSFRAASVELDNIQKSMALDVIGSVTFGALSQGELNLAKEVALPTGLSKDQLIDHLSRRKTAQEKLRGYYEEQIQFLDQGGTVAGFLRSKDREVDQQPAQAQAVQEQVAPQPAPTPAPQQAEQQFTDGQTATGTNGEKITFQNGQWVGL
jgi:lysozyme family protein